VRVRATRGFRRRSAIVSARPTLWASRKRIEQLSPPGNRDRRPIQSSPGRGERRKLVGYLNPSCDALDDNRWKIKTMMTIGMVVKKEPTSTSWCLQRNSCRSCEPQRQRPQRRAFSTRSGQRSHSLTLEAEDGERRDGRGRKRQNDRPEDCPLACAVNDRGLFQLAGDGFIIAS